MDGANGTRRLEWPPVIIPWDNNWEEYCQLIYSEYKKYYSQNNPFYFDGMVVKARKRPIALDKEGGFWHVIGGSEGVPEKERCERVLWARAIIENCQDDSVLVWEEPSKHDGSTKDVVFWLKDENYYVILAKRDGYWVIRSAYYIKYESKKIKLQKAYELYGSYKTRIASKS